MILVTQLAPHLGREWTQSQIEWQRRILVERIRLLSLQNRLLRDCVENFCQQPSNTSKTFRKLSRAVINLAQGLQVLHIMMALWIAG